MCGQLLLAVFIGAPALFFSLKVVDGDNKHNDFGTALGVNIMLALAFGLLDLVLGPLRQFALVNGVVFIAACVAELAVLTGHYELGTFKAIAAFFLSLIFSIIALVILVLGLTIFGVGLAALAGLAGV